MAKKIVTLLGSPRKNGNSTCLASQLIKGAEANGAVTETIYLNGLNIKPCQGCEKCKLPSSDRCIIKDDMHFIYPKLESADSIVLSSPVYFFNLSAQMKTFIDRCYAVAISEDFFKGKSYALLLTYADSDPFISGAVNVIRTFQDMCGYLGADIAGIVYGSAEKEGDINKNTEVMNQAYQLGEKLSV